MCTGEPSTPCPPRPRRQSRSARMRRRTTRTTASSTATTASAATPRPSTRCSTRRATCAGRTRASSPNWRRRTPPSWQPAPRRSVGRSSTRASRSRCPGQERPFPLDLVPRVISAAEWSRLEKGITQRVQGAGDVPRRHLRRAGDPARRRHPAPADHLLRALPPRGGGHRAAQRGAHPRRGHRPGPRRAGHLPGARGQPALAVGRLLRDGEPPHDGAGLPEPVRHPPGARGRRLRRRICCGRCATPRPPTRPTRPWWC